MSFEMLRDKVNSTLNDAYLTQEEVEHCHKKTK